jgi:LysR family hydrogen peroxide-inducible transcriptional activator
MIEPTIRQLEYLVAVADRAGFRRAAEACHVSQPGLSAQIKQLEEHLGVVLFERDRRRVRVTAAGEEIVARARRVLTEASELVDAARVFTRPLSGPLSLGVIPTIAPYWLPRTLPSLRRAYPELELRLREDHTRNLVKACLAGELDLLLLACEADLGGLQTLPIARDPFVVALPRGHPLCRRKFIRESDLEDQQVLLLEDGHCLRDQALDVCAAAGASELGDLRATSLGTLMQMVASGAGLTLLPEIALEVELRGSDEIEVRRFRKPQPGRTIGLAWRRTSPRAAEYRELATSLRP